MRNEYIRRLSFVLAALFFILTIGTCSTEEPAYMEDIRDYCEGRNDCNDGNEKDRLACIEANKGDRNASAKYGCAREWEEVMDCFADECSCETYEYYDYDYSYYSDDGDCNDEREDLWECIEDETGYDYYDY